MVVLENVGPMIVIDYNAVYLFVVATKYYPEINSKLLVVDHVNLSRASMTLISALHSNAVVGLYEVGIKIQITCKQRNKKRALFSFPIRCK